MNDQTRATEEQRCLGARRGLHGPDGDWHAEPGHPVENVACDLRLGPLSAQIPNLQTPADDGLVAIHRVLTKLRRL
jgi:hypothetical protein